jgi:hypothetical protein
MKRFAEANAMAAQKDKRTTTQHKDLGEWHMCAHSIFAHWTKANVVRRADEYAFLEGALQ